MIDQVLAFKILLAIFFVVGLLIFYFLRKYRVFVSDRACIYVSIAIAIHVYNFFPLFMEGGLVSYRDGEKTSSLELFGFLILVSLVPYWIAVLSERSLRKKLDKDGG
ncbi:MAG: hypothetical protein ABGX87_07990 [Alcanivorax sp.]|uniref:hypothetical protein n=1 Tax=Alloalcanivorax marinus TaxID=1177169 RepID=UPI0019576B4F|nr:hypothetical protein [Alloalcanivorax marinus]MBM7334323.1 hypothetical protein [Alloalcanivorax marinus]